MGWKARELDPEGKKIVLEVDGVVDSTNLEQFFVFVNSIFKRGFSRIVLDLEGASYLSSGGLSVIVDAHKRAREKGGKLVIARASDALKDLFEVVQFEKIMEFYQKLEEAIDAV